MSRFASFLDEARRDHLTTANGIYSASDKRVHFGLGSEIRVSHLEISRPSGIVQRLENPAINQVLHIAGPTREQVVRPAEPSR